MKTQNKILGKCCVLQMMENLLTRYAVLAMCFTGWDGCVFCAGRICLGEQLDIQLVRWMFPEERL